MSDIALIKTARDFNRFYTNFLGLLNKAYLDSRFTLTDARILFEIGSQEGVSAAALVRDLHLDPAYLSRILKRFRAEGLIKTSPDPADLRSQIINVTDRGREQFEELGRRANAQIAARFDNLAIGEPQAVVSAMDTIRALLDSAAKPVPAVIRAHRAGDIGWIVQSQGRFYAEEYGWDLRFEALVADVTGKFLANFDPEKEYCWIAEPAASMSVRSLSPMAATASPNCGCFMSTNQPAGSGSASCWSTNVSAFAGRKATASFSSGPTTCWRPPAPSTSNQASALSPRRDIGCSARRPMAKTGPSPSDSHCRKNFA